MLCIHVALLKLFSEQGGPHVGFSSSYCYNPYAALKTTFLLSCTTAPTHSSLSPAQFPQKAKVILIYCIIEPNKLPLYPKTSSARQSTCQELRRPAHQQCSEQRQYKTNIHGNAMHYQLLQVQVSSKIVFAVFSEKRLSIFSPSHFFLFSFNVKTLNLTFSLKVP